VNLLNRRAAWAFSVISLFWSSELSRLSEWRGANQMTIDEVGAVFRARLPAQDRGLSRGLAVHLLELCRRYQFHPAFILSVIRKESSFNPRAKSFVGAVGLMQFLPATARYVAERFKIKIYGGPQDLIQPKVSLSLGVSYLHYLRKRFSVPELYVAAYNLGPTRLKKIIMKGSLDLDQLELRTYVDEILEGVSELDREGKQLAIVARYARALEESEHLWRDLQRKNPGRRPSTENR